MDYNIAIVPKDTFLTLRSVCAVLILLTFIMTFCTKSINHYDETISIFLNFRRGIQTIIYISQILKEKLFSTYANIK